MIGTKMADDSKPKGDHNVFPLFRTYPNCQAAADTGFKGEGVGLGG